MRSAGLALTDETQLGTGAPAQPDRDQRRRARFRPGRLRRSDGGRDCLARFPAGCRLHRLSVLRMAVDLAAPYRRAQRRHALHRGRTRSQRCHCHDPAAWQCAGPDWRASSFGSAPSSATTTRRCLARDYSARVSTPPSSRASGAAPLQLVQRNPRVRFDVIRLDKMPETVRGQQNPMMALPMTLHPSGSYATPLAQTWDAFYAAKRSPSTRRRDRTKRNRLAEAGRDRVCHARDGRAACSTR